MAGWALLFLGVYLLLCFGARTMVHQARTGSTGFKGISGAPGSAEWVGGVLFAVALALGVAAPLLDLAGVLGPLPLLDAEVVQAAGGGLFFGGLVSTVVAQAAMGDSWRIGVDHAERTELVTDGPFAYVRNPIFAGMIPATLGIALLVGNVVAVVAVVLLVVALEIQTRRVEEPYLLSTHGRAYARYAARVGRFFPGVGRLRA
ncbi:MAG: isoprenylcysteine carboxylmethyltransferase family protein [Solirubrobacterales bacterium]|nr:isoprenylcysteine carboxylmethyltransferase family protein [Solirubrobacterales bacterium]